jgi:hypothetical protein
MYLRNLRIANYSDLTFISLCHANYSSGRFGHGEISLTQI